ncbi:uncharacterized protein [Procambarus clarkii]|uniref:uncharacterized protein n=1 Tax=Procambarus clarkii TaxID=6728 RepID=UPI003744162B
MASCPRRAHYNVNDLRRGNRRGCRRGIGPTTGHRSRSGPPAHIFPQHHDEVPIIRGNPPPPLRGSNSRRRRRGAQVATSKPRTAPTSTAGAPEYHTPHLLPRHTTKGRHTPSPPRTFRDRPHHTTPCRHSHHLYIHTGHTSTVRRVHRGHITHTVHIIQGNSLRAPTRTPLQRDGKSRTTVANTHVQTRQVPLPVEALPPIQQNSRPRESVSHPQAGAGHEPPPGHPVLDAAQATAQHTHIGSTTPEATAVTRRVAQAVELVSTGVAADRQSGASGTAPTLSSEPAECNRGGKSSTRKTCTLPVARCSLPYLTLRCFRGLASPRPGRRLGLLVAGLINQAVGRGCSQPDV